MFMLQVGCFCDIQDEVGSHFIAGTMNPTTPIHKLSTAGFRDVMNVAVEANFCK